MADSTEPIKDLREVVPRATDAELKAAVATQQASKQEEVGSTLLAGGVILVALVVLGALLRPLFKRRTVNAAALTAGKAVGSVERGVGEAVDAFKRGRGR